MLKTVDMGDMVEYIFGKLDNDLKVDRDRIEMILDLELCYLEELELVDSVD